ncbi:MAG: polyphosphate kinase 1 [Chitinophagales bacterium]|nr:polyphosphate kinase 1 [Chitinophagales bacterium]MDW8393602.1 polyphosphate kinase 1 [Chitinophagales bacterium]
MKYINRELGWLSFNARVLQEAADPQVPLLERLRFLGIFSSNLDEFFRVRVATLKRMKLLGKQARLPFGESPKRILEEIFSQVIRLQNQFNSIYAGILQELEKEKIHIINEKQLTPQQGQFVRQYFHDQVRGALVPLMVDKIEEFPYLRDHAIYLAVLLSDSKRKHKSRYALIEIPTDVVPRFLVLPSEDDHDYVILLDDVIRYCLDDIFYIFPHDSFLAWTVKLTRDAELNLLDDFNATMIEKLEKGLKQRRRGRPVRFIYDASIDAAMLNYFLERMKLKKDSENLVAGARYHNFKDFIHFPTLGRNHLRYPVVGRVPHPDLKPNTSILQAIDRRDILLHFPYHSFDHFIDFLREAAIDPKVQEIKITLYRLAKNSKVANALINAVRNGKKVIVVMELQARFDEEHNIYWSDRLREEGATVLFGIQGLKVHCKVCLIKRKENREVKMYANISTGNYNETTAQLYGDHCLFTCDRRLTHELDQMFTFFVNTYKVPNYKHLLLSPLTMRNRTEQLIRREMEHARKGRPAAINLKLNNLADKQMIDLLHQAALAGVKLRLIIRGACSFAPVSERVSAHLEIRSIVDRYLEHSRLMIFWNAGSPEVYLTSADWMIRNLDARVEMATPVLDPQIRNDLIQYFEMQWRDNVKARLITAQQDNPYVRNDLPPFRVQEELRHWLLARVQEATPGHDGTPSRAAASVQPMG